MCTAFGSAAGIKNIRIWKLALKVHKYALKLNPVTVILRLRLTPMLLSDFHTAIPKMPSETDENRLGIKAHP